MSSECAGLFLGLAGLQGRCRSWELEGCQSEGLGFVSSRWEQPCEGPESVGLPGKKQNWMKVLCFKTKVAVFGQPFEWMRPEKISK